MENDLFVNYDALCYATFINIKTATSGVNYIYLKGFDYNSKDHRFVLAVINACYNILEEKEVLIKVGPFQMGSIKRRYGSFMNIRKPKGEPERGIDVKELLDFMYPTARGLCGEDFMFGNIFDAYYSGKDNR